MALAEVTSVRPPMLNDMHNKHLLRFVSIVQRAEENLNFVLRVGSLVIEDDIGEGLAQSSRFAEFDFQ